MLNNPWPSLIWHMFDFYGNAGGSYYGAKKALEPLHIFYNYNASEAWVVNNRYNDRKNLQAEVNIWDINGKKHWSSGLGAKFDINGDGTKAIMPIPTYNGTASNMWFI